MLATTSTTRAERVRGRIARLSWAAMDRAAIAHAGRRRQALEALEFERARAAALRERLEAIVIELDGPAIDEAVFAAMAPDDVELVRPALQADQDAPLDSAEFELDLEDAAAEQAEWLEAEVVRLQDELAASRRREQAFERYLDALGRR
jgi:hypothetical protein